MEKATTLLQKEGHISLITPNSWLKNLMMSDCRNYILKNYNLISINPNISNAFEEASVDTLIYVASKKEETEALNDNEILIWGFEKGVIESKNTIPQSRFSANEKFVFDVEVDESTSYILQKTRNNVTVLSELYEITRGINPYDALRGQSKETIENRAYHANFKKDDTFVPQIRGKHTQKYFYEWDGKDYISYGNWLAAPRDEKFFKGDRIVFREILGVHNFVCTVVSEDIKIDRSLYIAIPKAETTVDVKFIQALLGSKLLAWSFRLEKNEFDALFPKIRLEEFKKLPIKITHNQTPFIEKVNQILTLKKANSKADTSELEAQIDRMVYDLYELTEEEILIVEGK